MIPPSIAFVIPIGWLLLLAARTQIFRFISFIASASCPTSHTTHLSHDLFEKEDGHSVGYEEIFLKVGNASKVQILLRQHYPQSRSYATEHSKPETWILLVEDYEEERKIEIWIQEMENSELATKKEL